MLCHLHHRVGGHGNEKSGRVDDTCCLDGGPVGLQVLNLVVVGRRQVCHQAPLTAHDARRAGPRRGRLIHVISGVDTVLGSHLPEEVRVVVLADRPKVGRRLWHPEHPLRHADRVLRRATRNILHLVILLELRVQGLVLLLGQNLVAELELVLVKERLVDDGADIEQGVSHAQQSVLYVTHCGGGECFEQRLCSFQQQSHGWS
mmetsp:Transcript_13358/g.38736  ORF Transcript_13358/g.38736 Transcript_13358/m.38736 type:complete len:203 (-) Transcript_13358:194-802(-)